MRATVFIAASVLAALSTGCVEPLENVAWLPDSSGVVYSDRFGTRLVRYDLKRKKKTRLTEEAHWAQWPAVSPDGKKVATAELAPIDQGGNVEFVLRDLDGKELSRSGVPTTKLGPTAVYWSGQPDKVLLSDTNTSGIYDIKKGTWVPVEGQPCPLFNRPVRPDGKGLLTFDKKTRQLFFYDWQGRKTALGKVRHKAESERVLNTAWDRAVWRVTTTHRVVEADTARGALKEKVAAPAVKVAGGSLQMLYPFPGGDAVLCLVSTKVGDRLELRRPAGKQPKVVTAAGDYQVNDIDLFPSPDGKLVAVRCREGNGDGTPYRLLIIDNSGAVLHNIQSAELTEAAPPAKQKR
jgi:hypothetical protein